MTINDIKNPIFKRKIGIRKSKQLSEFRRKYPCGYIYKITNLINGLIYVGQCHYTPEESKNYYGSGIRLNKDIKKLGKDNFKKEILERDILTFEELEEREIFWTEYFNPNLDPNIGYNFKCGNGTHLSEELLKKMSEVQKKWKRSPETSKKISNSLKGLFSGKNNPFYGKTHSIETRRLISINTSKKIKGIKRSIETRNKLRKQKLGELNPRSIKIYCYDINNNIIFEFPCIAEAARKLGINNSTMKYRVKTGKYYNGYRFSKQECE